MRVRVVWDRIDAETMIPRFAPEAGSEEKSRATG
jgi:hypothetical protein